MKNTRGKIIYVGKAKNLHNRLRTYFVTKIDDIKMRALVKEIHDFEIILTTSEVEALLLERTLIKHQKPRYNVLLRDDKGIPLAACQHARTVATPRKSATKERRRRTLFRPLW